MTASQLLLSEIELLPKEYEQQVLDFVSFLRSRSRLEASVPAPSSISIESVYGILKGTGIDSNIERDEEDRV